MSCKVADEEARCCIEVTSAVLVGDSMIGELEGGSRRKVRSRLIAMEDPGDQGSVCLGCPDDDVLVQMEYARMQPGATDQRTSKFRRRVTNHADDMDYEFWGDVRHYPYAPDQDSSHYILTEAHRCPIRLETPSSTREYFPMQLKLGP